MALDTLMNAMDTFSANKELQPLAEILEYIMAIDDNALTDEVADSIGGAIKGAYTDKIMKSALNSLLNDIKENNYSRAEVKKMAKDFKEDAVPTIIETLKPSKNKEKILNALFLPLCELYDAAVEHFNKADIDLPIYLEDGAQMPAYAHETDACADVYAYEDMLIPAHSLSNKVRTGVHIALPENWEVGLLPRSSIGYKTGLRLSNSRGVIDEQYRDELMILYDNISDSDYQIKAGDRIAQMFVQPTYRFNGVLTSKTDFDKIEGNRGGGLGSTGK